MGDKSGKAEIVIDSKGRSHYNIYQTYGTTCGPTCAAMVLYYNKQSGCKINADVSIKDILGWDEGFGVSRGTLAENMKNKLGISCELKVVDSKTSLFETLRGCVTWRTPAIVELDHSWLTMGHYAVCHAIDADGTCVFLDPASGLQEMRKEKFPFFRFNPQGKFFFSGGVIITR